MRIPFTKMHGLGNDFVVIDAIHHPLELTVELARHIADRRFGVGCDQILLVDPAPAPEVDFGYRIFNADGGEVEQCGNGARCFARFVRDKGLTDKNEISVRTLSGDIRPVIRTDGQVSVDMGAPEFSPEKISFDAAAQATDYSIEVAGRTIHLGVVSMGNPHAVIQVDDTDTAPVSELGPLLEGHARFPKRVNVGFMQIVDRRHIRLRVFERGAGETLACGTGACAAVAVGRTQGLLNDEVKVQLPGGDLLVTWPGDGSHVIMSGPAERVFEGWLEL